MISFRLENVPISCLSMYWFDSISVVLFSDEIRDSHEMLILLGIIWYSKPPQSAPPQSADPASLRLALCYTPFGPIYYIQ